MGDLARPRRRNDVLVQAVGDTVILLTPDSGEYFTLNEVGGRIWELLDGRRSVDQIVEILVAEYEAPESEIRGDTQELLGELSEQNLVSDGGTVE